MARGGHGRDGAAPVYGLDRFRRRPNGAEITARIGMAVFLGSWAMLFIALFFAYAYVRSGSAAWPPAGAPPLPRLLPGLNTAVVVAASWAVTRALEARQLGRTHDAARALALAAALGAVFLGLQTAVWVGLWRAGLKPTGGAYPSVFYAFTVFHALHVLVGIGATGWLAFRARRGGATATGVRLWGWYWHFVGAVWVAMYVTVYLA